MTSKKNAKNTALGAACDAAEVLTIEELVALCVRLQPAQAAQERDSRLCVTPLITRVRVDGQIVDLRLVEGRWGAGYPRVSDEVQRAAASQETRKRRRGGPAQKDGQEVQAAATRDRRSMNKPDGHSEEEQLTRQIHHFVRHRQAFKIYSDCGVTGEYPINDPKLIGRLLDAKACRYKKIYERTLLDETSRLRRTDEEVASMRAYLDRRLAQIRRGTPEELISDEDGDNGGDNGVPLLVRRGRSRKAVYFRQALTQLWNDIAEGKVHTVAISDRSRLCRAADLETAFLELLAKHGTRLIGLIEDLSSLDVSDPLKRGLTYLIASINEYRLEETAGHAFRGTLQLLESGHPCGRTPWWIERDAHGFARLVPERAALVRRIIDLSLSGLGLKLVARRLHEDNVRVAGVALGVSTLAYTLTSDALIGIHHYFGLKWRSYPPLIDAETYEELKRVRGLRDAALGALHDKAGWAEHVFTGILFCGVCGGPLSYNQRSKEREEEGREAGYYLCKAAHKTSIQKALQAALAKAEGDAAPNARPEAAARATLEAAADAATANATADSAAAHHACLNGVKLAAFFDELLSGSPHLLRQALTSGSQHLAQSVAQRAVAGEALRKARVQYGKRETEARVEAAEMAKGMGLGTSSAGFAATVTGIAASLMEADAANLAHLEEHLRCLDVQSARHSQSARALAAIDALQNWKTLDNLSRNRLLRALFTVRVHPMPRKGPKAKRGTQPPKVAGQCGYLDIRLRGVDTALSPAWMRRGPGKGISLPSVAEWIADMFAAHDSTDSTDNANSADSADGR